jgi:16S rRNA (cytidine1402-2'-O)-methyltransferase
MNKKNRKAHLESLVHEVRTMIFYEAPHKLVATLGDLTEYFGAERRISLCRELTKLHEEVRRTTLGEALEHYRENPPKGEFVLIVEGGCPPEEDSYTLEDGVAAVLELQQRENISRKDAVKRIAKEYGISKNVLYDATLKTP